MSEFDFVEIPEPVAETAVPAPDPELLIRPVQPKVLMMEAASVTTDNMGLVAEWIAENGGTASLQGDRLYLQTLDGPFLVRPGDDVVRGPQGFFRTDPELKLYEDAGVGKKR